jgi:hypothetical protein
VRRLSICSSMQALMAVSILSLVVFAGSNAAGQTVPSAAKPVPLVVESVRLEEAKLNNVVVLGWWKPSPKEALSVQKELEKILGSAKERPSAEQGKPLKLWVVLRRYLFSTTNTGSSSLVSVAWCAGYDATHILYHEEFYAAKAMMFAAVKGRTNKAIAVRIAESAQKLASLEDGATFQPIDSKGTYLKFEDAKKISDNLVTTAPPGMVWADGYGTYSGFRVDSGAEWAQHPDRINWNEYLSAAQAGAK